MCGRRTRRRKQMKFVVQPYDHIGVRHAFPTHKYWKRSEAKAIIKSQKIFCAKKMNPQTHRHIWAYSMKHTKVAENRVLVQCECVRANCTKYFDILVNTFITAISGADVDIDDDDDDDEMTMMLERIVPMCSFNELCNRCLVFCYVHVVMMVCSSSSCCAHTTVNCQLWLQLTAFAR